MPNETFVPAVMTSIACSGVLATVMGMPAAIAALNVAATVWAFRMVLEESAAWVIFEIEGRAMAAMIAITEIVTSSSTKLKAESDLCWGSINIQLHNSKSFVTSQYRKP